MGNKNDIDKGEIIEFEDNDIDDINNNVLDEDNNISKGKVSLSKGDEIAESVENKIFESLNVPKPIANLQTKIDTAKSHINPINRSARKKLGKVANKVEENPAIKKLTRSPNKNFKNLSKSSGKNIPDAASNGDNLSNGDAKGASSLKNALGNVFKSNKEENGESEGATSQKLKSYFKKHPMALAGILFMIFKIFLMLLIFFVIICCIMYAMQGITNLVEGTINFVNETGDSLENFFQGKGWKNSTLVYNTNLKNAADKFLENSNISWGDSDIGNPDKDVSFKKIEYYVNVTTFYTNIVNYEIVDDKEDGENIFNKDFSSYEPNMFINKEVTDTAQLIAKYNRVEDDPTILVPNMIACNFDGNVENANPENANNVYESEDIKKGYYFLPAPFDDNAKSFEGKSCKKVEDCNKGFYYTCEKEDSECEGEECEKTCKLSKKLSCVFSNEKYADYLKYGNVQSGDLQELKLLEQTDQTKYEELYSKNQGYVAFTYVDCKTLNWGSVEAKRDESECGFDKAEAYQKANAVRTMTLEIMDQAKQFYEALGAEDNGTTSTDYAAVNGITVKNSDGEVIGTYSVSEYVSVIVARDASQYSDEVKKAYAIYLLSKIYSNPTNVYYVEDDFNIDLATSEYKDLVNEVLGLRIIQNDKIQSFSGFDFGNASQISGTYKDILKQLYGTSDSIKVEEQLSKDGLSLDTETGFWMRIGAPAISDSNYYPPGVTGGNIGECAWYATKRANEITKALGVTYWNGGSANGGNFCSLPASNNYKKCYPSRGEKCEAKQGAIVSWDNTACVGGTCYGHVAVIEKVYSDGSILASDANVGKGGYALKYGYRYDKMWDEFSSNRVTRLDNCTKYGNTGCMATFKSSSKQALENRMGRFVCYIYLTDPK